MADQKWDHRQDQGEAGEIDTATTITARFTLGAPRNWGL
jgi:hypothetical protein